MVRVLERIARMHQDVKGDRVLVAVEATLSD
jgi:hypothetical protein